MRHGGRAVLIWPMTLRRRFAWRIAVALSGGNTEYAPVLVEGGPDAVSHICAARMFLRANAGADVVTIPFVRQDSALHHALSADRARRTTHTLPSPFLAWDGIASWEDYRRSLTSKLRSELTRRRRRLAELGNLTLELVEDAAAFAENLDWTLRQKNGWMARKALANEFLATPEYRDFLLRVFATPSPGGRLVMFALKLDGRTIATRIATIDAVRCESFITVYDPAFASHSPGQIILVDCLQWCHERGLTFDFRIGDETYKRDWANGDCPATTYQLANTHWGAISLTCDALLQRLREMKDRLRTRIPASWRRRVKAAVASPWSIGRRVQRKRVAVSDDV
jgi:CelD/BcsL family acetyltransferase involved in cellulose biosynthesis